MRNCISHSVQPTASQNFWVLYWYRLWQLQSSGLATAHLSAYLQEPCYWAAHKTIANFASTQYTLSDCFQIAIARTDRVLSGFDPGQGFTLKMYAGAIFSSVIKETLRQAQEVDICTNWALLRKLSHKRLVQSLQSVGLSSEAIERYIFAWSCFKTIYVPTQATGTRRPPRPDPACWEAVAQLYNTERYTQPNLPEGSAQKLEQWLSACAIAARSYLYPSVTSIDIPKAGLAQGTVADDLPQSLQQSVLAELIEREEEQDRQLQQDRLNAALTSALDELKPQMQELLQLYYGQGLTQQQMAARLQMKQYTVSRQLSRAREALLISLARWSQDTLHISLTPEVLRYTSNALEEWLKARYNNSEISPATE